MKNMIIEEHDKEILRSLAAKVAKISSLSIHKEKAELWTQLNSLKKTRPLVWIDEIPWHEMNVNDELTLQAKGEWARQQELKFRRLVYQYDRVDRDLSIDENRTTL